MQSLRGTQLPVPGSVPVSTGFMVVIRSLGGGHFCIQGPIRLKSEGPRGLAEVWLPWLRWEGATKPSVWESPLPEASVPDDPSQVLATRLPLGPLACMVFRQEG